MYRIILSFTLALLPSLAFCETIKIGLVIPLTGNQAVYGIDSRRTVELLAPNKILKRGRYTFEFILEDGQCGVGRSATTAARKLINVDKVKFLVLGCSGEVLQVGPLAEKAKILAIGFAASHPDIRNLGDYIFRTYVDITKAVNLIADLMMREQHGGIALLTEESPFTLGIEKEMLKVLGTHVVFHEDFHVDEVGFQSLITKARASHPKAYYLNTASPKTYETLYRQLRQLGISDPVYSYHAPSDADVLKALGNKQDGVKFVATPEIHSGSPEFVSFLKKYNAKYSEGPHIDFILRTSFDALMSIVHGIEAVGPEPDQVKQYLYTHEGRGALGKLAFDHFGDVKDLNFMLKVIVDGKPKALS